MSYNLLEEEWIPVLGTDGKPDRVGIKGALTHAGNMGQIAAADPMDNVALLRLLLAVLHWCKPGVSEDELSALRDDGARGVPEGWLEKLEQNKVKFELLGDGPRFYQDSALATAKPNRPVSAFFPELPGATEINHFRHVYDRSVALCPPCCAVGLARLPAFATAGGAGLSPSINNAPPMYFVPVGDTLLETLVLNWPTGRQAADHPAWEAGRAAGTRIGMLEGLTWQPRTMWIEAPTQESEGTCARCEAREPLVSRLVFKKGRRRVDDNRDWRDPHVAWLPEKEDALRGPDPLKYSQLAASLWSQVARAILQSLDPLGNAPPIAAVAQAIGRLARASPLRISCSQPFTKPGQKKWFDGDGHVWRIRRGIVQNTALAERALAELNWLDGVNVRKTLQRSLPGSPGQSGAALTNLVPETEHLLCGRFEQLLEALDEAEGDEGAQQCTDDWRSGVERVLREKLNEGCAVTAIGSPLRRREAARRAAGALSQAMRKVAKASEKDATQSGVGKRGGS